MITVGEILRNKRLERKLTLSQIEKSTKIREKFLYLIENNEFDKFSSQTVLRGFIKNYATLLGLPIPEIMAFYRRQSDEKFIVLTPKESEVKSGFAITPRIFTLSSIGIALSLFFLFLIYQYWQFVSAPPLIIDRPPENTVFQTDEVEIAGKTDPDAMLTINDQPVKVSETGSFTVKIPLSAGLNTLTFKASNKYQKTTTKLRHLRLELPNPS